MESGWIADVLYQICAVGTDVDGLLLGIPCRQS